jgi:hypothetical protein
MSHWGQAAERFDKRVTGMSLTALRLRSDIESIWKMMREGGGAREEEICSSLTHLRRKEFCAAKKYNPHKILHLNLEELVCTRAR